MGNELDTSTVCVLQPTPASMSTHPDASSGMAVLAVHVLPDYALCVSCGFGPMLNCMRAEQLKKSPNANWAASL